MTEKVMFYIGDRCLVGTIIPLRFYEYPGYSFVVVRDAVDDIKNWKTTVYRILTDTLIYLRKDQ